MPKENTHLFFANNVLEKLDSHESKAAIRNNIDCYYLGSVIPDAFLFSRDSEKEKLADFIHGTFGNPTNVIIFQMLDEAKKKKRSGDFAFISGILTHFALDMIFHPIIISLTGNPLEKDPDKRRKIIFSHQHFETYLDKKVNKSFFFKDLVSTEVAEKIPIFETFCQELKISQKVGEKIIKRQYFINSILGDRKFYILARVFNGLGIIVTGEYIRLLKMNLTSFEELEKKEDTIPSVLKYRDLASDECKEASISELFNEAELSAVDLISAARNYYDGKTSREECTCVIAGQSLETGRVDCLNEKKILNMRI